jgi:hypothetical protein
VTEFGEEPVECTGVLGWGLDAWKKNWKKNRCGHFQGFGLSGRFFYLSRNLDDFAHQS